MALFGSRSHSHDEEDDDYSSPMDEEQKPLRIHHDNDEPRSSTPHHDIYSLNRSIRRTNLFLKIIIGLLSITIIAMLSINIPKDLIKDLVKQTSCLTDVQIIKTPVPPIPIEKVTFAESKIYSQRPNPESDAAWNALLPEGRGFVYIPEWEKYDLPPGQNTSYGMIYSVSLFHQMHCLGQLRRFSYMFLDAIEKGEEEKYQDIRSMFITQGHSLHMNHCFDYLRQGIQCAGDMTMEWPRTEPDGERFAVDGWDIPHECRSWSHIQDYMDKKHFDHSTNSEIAPLEGPDI